MKEIAAPDMLEVVECRQITVTDHYISPCRVDRVATGITVKEGNVLHVRMIGGYILSVHVIPDPFVKAGIPMTEPETCL